MLAFPPTQAKSTEYVYVPAEIMSINENELGGNEYPMNSEIEIAVEALMNANSPLPLVPT